MQMRDRQVACHLSWGAVVFFSYTLDIPVGMSTHGICVVRRGF